MAELVDARDLKSPGATEITHLSDLTRACNPHEAGGDPAVLSNTPPPLPLAGKPSKTWADVILRTSINRRKDRCRLLQSAIASWSLCAAVSAKPLRPPSGPASRRNTPAAPDHGLVGSIAQNRFESGVEIPSHFRHAGSEKAPIPVPERRDCLRRFEPQGWVVGAPELEPGTR